MTKLSEQIIGLHEQGKSYGQIQVVLGCSKGTISYHLGAGQKEKSVQRTRDKRSEIQKYIQEVKQSSICVDCKEDYPYWMLEFDHLGNKSFNISGFRSLGVTLALVKLEIEKCEVVCANCHKNRTYLRAVSSGNSIMDISDLYN